MTATTSRIALCDDHPIVLNGLQNLIESEPDFEIVGTATDGLAALKLIAEKLPDIALIDISMPELNGIALARRLQQEAPSVRVVVLTVYEDRAFLKQALDAGVRGYLLKRSAAESLIQAARAVLTGGIYVDPAMADRLFVNSAPRQRRNGDKPLMPALTGRARTILRAGLALNIISAPVNGFLPMRALVAGFFTTTNLAKPGTTNTPVFFSSL